MCLSPDPTPSSASGMSRGHDFDPATPPPAGCTTLTLLGRQSLQLIKKPSQCENVSINIGTVCGVFGPEVKRLFNLFIEL